MRNPRTDDRLLVECGDTAAVAVRWALRGPGPAVDDRQHSTNQLIHCWSSGQNLVKQSIGWQN